MTYLSTSESQDLHNWQKEYFAIISYPEKKSYIDWENETRLFLIANEKYRNKNHIITFPECFRKLKQLTFIRIEGFSMPTIPDIILYLHNIETIMFNDLGIEYIPENIDNLKNLKKLDLNNNHISNIPDSFSNLCFLEEIGFSNNNFEHFPDIFHHFLNLSRIWLYKNKITQIPKSLSYIKDNIISVSFEENPIQNDLGFIGHKNLIYRRIGKPRTLQNLN